MELVDFNPQPTCPKCAGKNIGVIHYEVNEKNNGQPNTPEHLERKCRACTFTWYEKPLSEKRREKEEASS